MFALANLLPTIKGCANKLLSVCAVSFSELSYLHITEVSLIHLKFSLVHKFTILGVAIRVLQGSYFANLHLPYLKTHPTCFLTVAQITLCTRADPL